MKGNRQKTLAITHKGSMILQDHLSRVCVRLVNKVLIKRVMSFKTMVLHLRVAEWKFNCVYSFLSKPKFGINWSSEVYQHIINKSKFCSTKKGSAVHVFNSKIYSHRKSKMCIENKLRAMLCGMYIVLVQYLGNTATPYQGIL